VTATTTAPGTRPDFLQEQRTPRLVAWVWVLLVINTVGTQHSFTVFPFPKPIAQMITMGAVVAAFMLALLLNPRGRLRPSAYLLLLTLVLVASIVSSARLESGFGALFRCFRLTMFVATLWLLTRWWHDWLLFVRTHVRALAAVLFTVVLGLAISPGTAMSWPGTPQSCSRAPSRVARMDQRPAYSR